MAAAAAVAAGQTRLLLPLAAYSNGHGRLPSPAAATAFSRPSYCRGSRPASPLLCCRNLPGLGLSLEPVRRRSRTVVSAIEPEKSSVETESDPLPSKLPNIWLSDVVVKWKRPYFLNRHWTGQDFIFIAIMTSLHGLCLLAPFTFTWSAFGAFLGLYVVTGLFGITLSYHRNLSHKSFKLPKWLEYTFAYCGALALQGDPLDWVSSHRYHHQHCDTIRDPHSPHEGLWYSHMGWMFDSKSTLDRVGVRSNVNDMAKDPFYQFLSKTYAIHPLALALGMYAVGGLPYLIWGVVVRTVWVYHITWAVNSAAHVWGTQKWNTGDLSRNNWWVALLAFGEGWHNNHHAFEYSARHGLEWWQLDLTWYLILALEKLGLATDVKLPRQEQMARLALPTLNG